MTRYVNKAHMSLLHPPPPVLPLSPYSGLGAVVLLQGNWVHIGVVVHGGLIRP